MKKVLKAAGAAYTMFAFMLLFGKNVNAYIDPSVLTYVIQAVAGVVIAVGAVVGIYWRKAKKKIDKTLGVDENRNKEVESDEIVDTTESEDESPVSANKE